MKNDNLLIKADNIIGLEWLIRNGYEGKIDLVYIDPPFATGGVFGVDSSGRVATVSKSADGQIAYTTNSVVRSSSSGCACA